MRILTFTNLFPNSQQPNYGIFVYQRVIHIQRQPGNSVYVVAPVPYFPAWLPIPSRLVGRQPFLRWQALSRIPRKERIYGLTVHHPRYFMLPTLSMPVHGLLMFLGSLFLVWRLQKQIGFHCIDAHFAYPDGLAAATLGFFLRLPVVVTVHGSDLELYSSSRVLRPMLRWTFRRAKKVICVCKALQKQVRDLQPNLPGDRVCVIRNGVDSRRFHPVDRKLARSRLGIPGDVPIILNVGALIPHKGHQLLISAVASVAGRTPGLRTYVIGDGILRSELEEGIRRLKIQESVVMVGEIPNDSLNDWYNAADVTCLVSSREGWPCVLMESLSCGTPVVATSVGGTPEALASSELGILAERNVSSISSGLELALTKKWCGKTMIHYARQHAWESVSEQISSVLADSAITANFDGERRANVSNQRIGTTFAGAPPAGP